MGFPRLNSLQESVLEELIQRSFGAQNLYVPHRYARGNGLREPADLVWHSGKVAIFFYLKSGEKSLEKQDLGNIRQAKGWARYWSRKSSNFLKARNRYGDTLILQSSQINIAIYVSIVSHPSGIVFHSINEIGPPGFLCTIPEHLVHELASIGGTSIDLLNILLRYAENFRRRLLRHDRLGAERLESITRRLTLELDQTTSAFKQRLNPFPQLDFEFVSRILGVNRLPAPIGGIIVSSPQGRRQIAQFFNDMSAREYIILSLSSVAAIQATDSARNTVSVLTQGMFLNWQILATSIRASNILENFEAFGKRSKEDGTDDLPQIIFGWDFEGADYRSPPMYAMPEKKGISQAERIASVILRRLEEVFNIYGNSHDA